jgi:hypothetical protein
MTDTIKNNIEFYKTIEYDNIDYPVYKVINKKILIMLTRFTGISNQVHRYLKSKRSYFTMFSAMFTSI